MKPFFLLHKKRGVVIDASSSTKQQPREGSQKTAKGEEALGWGGACRNEGPSHSRVGENKR